ncbi:MAG: hypothetical protein Q4C34_08595 [Bacteroidales bacterium]|nr:hypothetical protein [Bacteroidales bacterium]
MERKNKLYWWKAIASFLFVLFMMPLGHALMIIMEHTMSETALHYSAFAMGAAGMVMVIVGVFVKGDTKQTLWGLFGGLLFWTGWVEFLFMYFANRFGTQPQLDPVTGEVVTRPEYLIMPASFGFWMMIMILYIFCTRNGCNFINWWQRRLLGDRRTEIAARPMTRHTSIVTFLELMMILWASYLLLMFCYDNEFLGDHHPVTLVVGVGCFIGSFFIFAKQLRIPSWGANIRMAIATVIVFWTPVEIMGRMNIFQEIWIAPMEHKAEMIVILAAFVVLGLYLWHVAGEKKQTAEQ